MVSIPDIHYPVLTMVPTNRNLGLLLATSEPDGGTPETALIHDAQEGNREALNSLTRRYLQPIHEMAERARIRFPFLDPFDVESRGCVLLLKVVNRFNPSKNERLGPLLRRSFTNMTLDLARKHQRRQRHVRFLSLNGSGKEEGLRLEDILTDRNSHSSETANNFSEIILEHIRELLVSDLELKVIEYSYGINLGTNENEESLTALEIAERLDIDRGTVFNKKRLAIKRLKAAFELIERNGKLEESDKSYIRCLKLSEEPKQDSSKFLGEIAPGSSDTEFKKEWDMVLASGCLTKILSPEQIKVIELAFSLNLGSNEKYEKLTQHEIAERLGIGRISVLRRKDIALIKIRTALEVIKETGKIEDPEINSIKEIKLSYYGKTLSLEDILPGGKAFDFFQELLNSGSFDEIFKDPSERNVLMLLVEGKSLNSIAKNLSLPILEIYHAKNKILTKLFVAYVNWNTSDGKIESSSPVLN